MKVKFKNGVVKSCTAPTEQKVFRNVDGVMVGVGWLLNFRIAGGMTSDEVDNVLTLDNITSLEFLAETENGEDKTIFVLDGYDKITSSVIRHTEDTTSTSVEIQLSKGL